MLKGYRQNYNALVEKWVKLLALGSDFNLGGGIRLYEACSSLFTSGSLIFSVYDHFREEVVVF